MRWIIINTGKCAKQETIAIIECLNGKYYIGTNYCDNAQEECPRKDLPTGVGYELCRVICRQNAHAEVDACFQAGFNARGGTLYLLGHTYCCEDCTKVMNDFGITNVIIGDIPESFKSKIVKQETPKMTQEYIDWGVAEKYGNGIYEVKINTKY